MKKFILASLALAMLAAPVVSDADTIEPACDKTDAPRGSGGEPPPPEPTPTPSSAPTGTGVNPGKR